MNSLKKLLNSFWYTKRDKSMIIKEKELLLNISNSCNIITSKLDVIIGLLNDLLKLKKRLFLLNLNLKPPKINLEGEEMDKIKFSVVLPDWPVSDVVEANVNVSVYYNGELLKSDSYTVQPPETVISGLEGPQDSLVRVNMSYVDDAGNVSNVVSFEQILLDVFAPEPPLPGIIRLEGEVWEHDEKHKEVEEHEPEAKSEEHEEVLQEEHEESAEARPEVSEDVEEHHSDDVEPAEDHHDDVVQSGEEDHTVASESDEKAHDDTVAEEKHEVVEVTEEMVSEEHVHEDVSSEEEHHEEVVEEHKDEHEEQHDVVVETNELPFPEVEGNVKVVNDVNSEEGKDLENNVVEVEELPIPDAEVSEEKENE